MRDRHKKIKKNEGELPIQNGRLKIINGAAKKITIVKRKHKNNV